MNQAIFRPLPAIRPRMLAHLPASHPNNFQQDEVFAVNHHHHVIRTLHPKWWQEFRHPLPVGTRVEIRHDVIPDQEQNFMGRRTVFPGHQVTYQVIAIENDTFRVVSYVYNLGEAGPERDMTRDQYYDRFYPIPEEWRVAAQAAPSAAFFNAYQPTYSPQFSAIAAAFATPAGSASAVVSSEEITSISSAQE
jgi:hypothetical protein